MSLEKRREENVSCRFLVSNTESLDLENSEMIIIVHKFKYVTLLHRCSTSRENPQQPEEMIEEYLDESVEYMEVLSDANDNFDQTNEIQILDASQESTSNDEMNELFDNDDSDRDWLSDEVVDVDELRAAENFVAIKSAEVTKACIATKTSPNDFMLITTANKVPNHGNSEPTIYNAQQQHQKAIAEELREESFYPL